MNKYKPLFLFLLLFLFTNCTQKTEKIETKETQKTLIKKEKIHNHNIKQKPYPDKFIKGIYLNAYTIASKKFDLILNGAKKAGINTVVFDLKNMNGNIFFKISYQNTMRQRRVLPIVDVNKTVDKLHDNNMRAVARIVMFHDQFLAKNDSLLRPKKKDNSIWQENKKGKPSWLDPSNPKVQDELLELIEKVAQTSVDEIQMDYIRFPTQGNIGDAVFYFQKEDQEFAKRDSLYVFRQKIDIIEDFISRAKNICLKYDVKLTGDVFAIVAWQSKIDVANTGQDMKRMTRHLDAIHPMIYSSHFTDNFAYRENAHNEPFYLMYNGTKLTQENSNKKCKVIPYIQANNWEVNYKPEYIYAQIRAIESCRANGFILWDASNNYLKTLQWIEKYYSK